MIIADGANEQATLHRVNSIFRPYVQHLTVQIQRNNWEVSNQLREVDMSQ